MIYLDNAATAIPDRECVEKAEKYLFEVYFNPSALYKCGYSVQNEIKVARKNVITAIGNQEAFDVIFTSGGTESDNQAVFCAGKRGNVITTAGEHSAVFNSVNELKMRGIEVRFAELNSDGSVNADKLFQLVDEKTSLVSVIHVNNETGAINDIAKLASVVKAKNKYALFHSDGVQAFGKIPFRLTKDIDLYSVSAHKIGGIKGTGALFKRKNLNLKPYIYGGGQENGLRNGTENVFGIMAFAFATEKKYSSINENYEKVERLHKLLWDNLDKTFFKRISGTNCSPYILCVSAEGLRGETILHEADDKGLIIGTGSACSSNEKKRYSRVILSCGVNDSAAEGILRLSLNSETTEMEILAAAEILNVTVKNRKEIMS